MTHRQTTLERAFELANSGEVSSVAEIVKRLKAEGLNLNQLEGRQLTKQLNALIKAADTNQTT